VDDRAQPALTDQPKTGHDGPVVEKIRNMCDSRAMSSVMTAGVPVSKVCLDPMTVE